MDLTELRVPIVQAPLAGGASTPRLAAAVAEAGGLGFLAAGYKTAAGLAEDIHALRSLTRAPFGVNLFAAPAPAPPSADLDDYRRRLAQEAERYGTGVGDPRHDDDDLAAKLDLLVAEPVAIVSFTFGCPSAETVSRLHAAGIDVWVTITSPEEAEQAQAAGAVALVVQGYEAGGHRSYFADGAEAEDFGLLALLRLIAARSSLPLVAAGGIGDGAAVAAVLCAGASAAQVGTALMLTPEAGTAAVHRRALRAGGPTALTRAFSGKPARGIVNRFMREHGGEAPPAYPAVHHMTAPIRAAAREQDDPEAVNLWAGQAHTLAQELLAAQVVEQLMAQARAAADGLADRLG